MTPPPAASAKRSLLDSLKAPAAEEEPVRFGELDDQLFGPIGTRPPRAWFVAFGISSAAVLTGAAFIAYTLAVGIGVWGDNIPVAWAFGVVNFSYWLGIGCAGTLISALLLLFRARWRNAISRFAETMTLIALACAVLFPFIQSGRPWLAFWLVPYPNQRGLWPNFRSPLLWDAFALSAYFVVAFLFWYLGMIPDLASLRDRTIGRARKRIYGVLSLGWRGASSHWHHHERAYLLLAGLATGLALSGYGGASLDFAASLVPGWHRTIFPFYFVTGAVSAGSAMVVLGMTVIRSTMRLGNLITEDHLDRMNRVVLTCSCLMAYACLLEGFSAWYSANPGIRHSILHLVEGTFGWAGRCALACTVAVPQLLWFRWFRRRPAGMIFVSLAVTAGVWFERFVIVVSALHRDFLSSSWHEYAPTMVDAGILLGSFGLFFSLMLLFAREIPVVVAADRKRVLSEAPPHSGKGAYEQ